MKLPKTIRGRLTLWVGAAMAVVLIGFAAAVFTRVRGTLLGEVRTRLHEDLASTAAFVRDNPDNLAEMSEFKPDALVLVLEGQAVQLRSAPWERIGLPEPNQLNLNAADWLWETPADHHYRIGAQTVAASDRSLLVAVAIDEEPVQRALWTLAWTLGVSVPVLIGLSVFGGYMLAGRMLSPVRRMAAASERISGERLNERLPAENPADELGRLATVTNQSLDRLQEAMERQRRFTADASHEMRTPLTAIRSAGEVALRRAQSPNDYRETIGSMLEGVRQLTHLIDRLLLLARADAGNVPLKLERFDAAEVAREVSELLQPVADERSVAVEASAQAELPVIADRMLFRQALLNLLDNAIKHSPNSGSVRLEATAANGTVAVAIHDHGPGIAPEHHNRVFERFFRIDPSRNRGVLDGGDSGAGLGLAIAKWAIESSGGRITLRSTPGEGCTFTIVMPADHGPSGQRAS
jgi:heavy metal sensor kinase